MAIMLNGGVTILFASSTAANGTFINNGADGVGSSGGSTHFLNNSTAENATLIANGGQRAGGSIFFQDDSTGGRASVEVFGKGNMDISSCTTRRV